MNERDRVFLLHIRDCCERVRDYTQGGRSAFMASSLHQDAVVRNFQIIGEASKSLSEQTRSIGIFPWRQITDFRNFLVHQYMGVDYRLVWDVIERDLPMLEAHVLALLET